MNVPIYQERGTRYEADACGPVARAAEAGQIAFAALTASHYPGRRLPRRALPGVKTVGYWDATRPQDWGLDWHRNEGIEITLLESGSTGFAVEDREFTLRPSDLTVTRPWQRHRVGDPRVGSGRLHFVILDVGVRRPHQAWHWPSWVVLAPGDLRELTETLRHNERPVWRATPKIAACFRRLASAVESERGAVSSLAVGLNQLLLLLLDMFRRENVPLDASLADARRTVELFWADLARNRDHLALEWTVREMARRCDMGVTNFTNHSRQLTNMTPMRYLNHCRLDAAAERLRAEPRRAITEIALECGFGSSQYFATLFRRQFHAAPRTWRSERDP